MSRRVTFLCVGTRGDVAPYLVLAQAVMRRLAAQVTVACPAAHAASVQALGLLHAPLELDVAPMLRHPGRDGSALAQLRWLRDGLGPRLVGLFEQSLEACRDADVVIGSLLAVSAGHVAERLGRPYVAAYLQPASRTRHQPVTASSLKGPGWLNALTHTLSAAVLQRLFRAPVDAAREEVLGLPPAERAVPLGQQVLYGYSARVSPRPPDWGPHISVTGYWLDRAEATLSAPLQRWLEREAGAPTVYVGFGSMRPAPLEAVAALTRAGCRVVYGGAEAAGLGDACAVGFEPHRALFPRMSVVVHHGGAGTTAAALRAGVPQVVVPQLGDQRFWARCIAARGVGVGPVKPSEVAGAVGRCLGDPELRREAERLGALVEAEEGESRAAALIERSL